MGAAVGLSLALNQFEVLSKVTQGRMTALTVANVFVQRFCRKFCWSLSAGIART
jgi:hypothetical protein